MGTRRKGLQPTSFAPGLRIVITHSETAEEDESQGQQELKAD